MRILPIGVPGRVLSLIFVGILSIGSLSCRNKDDNNGAAASACASGANDFYVVENNACAIDGGALSRVNPDVPCKEQILTGLDCPIDFVLGSGGIGYLSLRTNDPVGPENAQPGQIYQVDVVAKQAYPMNDGAFFRQMVAPTGLALLENLSDAEQDAFCGGNTIIRDILFIADEGDLAGTVWMWCINTESFDDSLTLMAVLSAGADQMKNPRGVAVVDRSTLYVTARSVTDGSGILLSKGITSTSQASVEVSGFTSEIKDVAVDLDDSLLISDGGLGEIWRFVPGDNVYLAQEGLGGPRDILVRGVKDYVITEFDTNSLVGSELVDGAATNIAETITLAGPDGIAW